MTDSFELLTGGITSVYKSIQKIKKLSMPCVSTIYILHRMV